MTAPLAAALLGGVALLLPATGLSFPIQIEPRTAPRPGGGVETFLHVSVPAFDGGGVPPRARLVTMVFDGERAVAISEWAGPLESGGSCRAPLAVTRVVTLPPGSYRVRGRVEPEGGEPAEAQRSFRVPDLAAEPLRLSELTVGCLSGGGSPSDTLFPQGTDPVDPSLLCLWFRVDGGATEVPDTVYTIRVRLRDDAGGGVEETWSLSRGETDVFWRPASPVAGGRYRLRVEVRLGRLRQERTVPVTLAGGPLRREPWVLRTLLGYVATPEELVEVEDTPDGELPVLWRRFWERRDPRPETPVNEALVNFESRVAEASRRFGGLDPGWESDQGRIFIRLGEPDQIESIPPGAFRPAGEIWYYYERHATFVFQDVDGFGRLDLIGGR
jgi:GWxTD domain-containing protein